MTRVLVNEIFTSHGGCTTHSRRYNVIGELSIIRLVALDTPRCFFFSRNINGCQVCVAAIYQNHTMGDTIINVSCRWLGCRREKFNSLSLSLYRTLRIFSSLMLLCVFLHIVVVDAKWYVIRREQIMRVCVTYRIYNVWYKRAYRNAYKRYVFSWSARGVIKKQSRYV